MHDLTVICLLRDKFGRWIFFDCYSKINDKSFLANITNNSIENIWEQQNRVFFFVQHAARIVQHYAWMKLTPGMCRHSINDMPSEPWMRCRANWSRSHLVRWHSAFERNIIPMNVSVFVFNQEPNQPFYTVWVAHRISRNIKITDDEYDETASEQCNYDLEKKKQIYGRTMDGMNNIYRPLCYYDLMSVCIVDVDALYGMALVASSYTRHARISSGWYRIIQSSRNNDTTVNTLLLLHQKKSTQNTQKNRIIIPQIYITTPSTYWVYVAFFCINWRANSFAFIAIFFLVLSYNDN